MQKFRAYPLILWLFLLPLLAQPSLGADATSFDPTRVEVKAKGSGVPVGMILAWPVGQNPEDMDNWLECNGQSISRSVYPELYALMGGNVPDLRGLFLRGHGAQSSTHYGNVTHQSGNLGELQGDAARVIESGQASAYGFFASTGSYDSGGALKITKNGYVGNSFGGGAWHALTLTLDLSRGIPTANENRPVNQAVRYLIRARQ